MATNGSENERVLAVVPTYLPQHDHLAELCTALAEQVDHVLLVDNSEQEQQWLYELCTENVSVRILGTNLGIAAAQNRGARWAKEQGFDFVLFLDQDSRPTRGMVKGLIAGFHDLVQQGLPVAAVGPAAFVESADTLEPFYTASPWGVGSRHCLSPQEHIEVAYLHASGSLVCTRIFDRVGLLAEKLFIDLVDLEWCFRAKKLGLLCFGLCSARLQHQVGEVSRPLPVGKWATMSVHAPWRGYYQSRNIVLLMRNRSAPTVLLLHFFVRRVLCRLLAQLLFAGNRKQRLTFFMQGLVHGVQGIDGPYRP